MNVLEELKGAETVGITGHIRPDGDCIGSCMGLYSYLKDNCPQLDVTVYLETPGSDFIISVILIKFIQSRISKKNMMSFLYSIAAA